MDFFVNSDKISTPKTVISKAPFGVADLLTRPTEKYPSKLSFEEGKVYIRFAKVYSYETKRAPMS